MKVKILCFAYVREITGEKQISLEIPEGTNASGLLDDFCRKYPASAPHREYLRLSMNEELLSPDDLIDDGAILAVFPPVGGG